ncbi:MAG: Holliday junction resolvase RuvX [Spirochaetia bacterium]|nr:Holliday junction resolvase RuvX [Spirochaetia bacterium]
MRIIALDPGTVRIGVAMSDEARTIASPLSMILNNERFEKELLKLKEGYEFSTVLIGNPLNMDGTKNPKSTWADELKFRVEKAMPGMEIILWDERLSSAEAEEILLSANVSRKKRKEVRDKIAAALILKSYLDKTGRNKNG